jgi:hypothetical protein
VSIIALQKCDKKVAFSLRICGKTLHPRFSLSISVLLSDRKKPDLSMIKVKADASIEI